MAEQLPQTTLFKPMIAATESLGRALPKVVKESPQYVGQSFKNVRDISKRASSPGKIPTSLSELGTMTTPYEGSTAYEGVHPGIDIANVKGTKIPAFRGGEVTEVVSGQGWTPDTPSFGNYVVVKDDNGNFHRYSHLQNSYVKIGDLVEQGSVLGTMGGTGSTYGSTKGDRPGIHLDYRIFDAAKKYYNPSEYLK